MKKSLPYLIVSFGVLFAHVGVAMALISAANSPEPSGEGDSTSAPTPAKSPSPPAPGTAAEQEEKPGLPSEKTETEAPNTSRSILPPAPVIGAPVPAQTAPPVLEKEKEIPAVLPPLTITPPEKVEVGPPVPVEERARELLDTPVLDPNPTEPAIAVKPLAPLTLPEPGKGAGEKAAPAETAPAAKISPAPMMETAPPAAEVSTPAVAFPATAGAAVPATATPKNAEVTTEPPAKKEFRAIKVEEIETKAKEAEKMIREKLPSAVEAFAPESIDANDIDAVIREAQSNLRRRVDELKATQPSVPEPAAVNRTAPGTVGPPLPNDISPTP